TEPFTVVNAKSLNKKWRVARALATANGSVVEWSVTVVNAKSLNKKWRVARALATANGSVVEWSFAT
ncbi:MAG TPA: hypothetical protein VFH31_02330, partial [Pyrinomonadaceae bacterium]|nr:hypothetical protein [Pyrinomonadaceae bacterium]